MYYTLKYTMYQNNYIFLQQVRFKNPMKRYSNIPLTENKKKKKEKKKVVDNSLLI